MVTEVKTAFVKKIFSSVAEKYDLMNDLMSFGLHRAWKSAFINRLNLYAGLKILDSACGTGDIAYRIIKKEPLVQICLSDINSEMLDVAKARFIDANLLNACFVCADAENLSFVSASFDCYTIVFGIRNVNNIKAALKEAYRVLKDGGKFLCMEFGHVQEGCVSKIYDLYSFKIIPEIGKRITGNKEAYQYLVDSIRAFPYKEDFIIMMHEAGFKNIVCETLSAGIVNIYSGFRN